MTSYALFLTASLLFYIAGIFAITSGHSEIGVAFISLGCTFFAIAPKRRKKQK